eukprot:gene7917-10010_t
MSDDHYSLPQDSVPDFRNVPKPQRDTTYAEPEIWSSLKDGPLNPHEEEDDQNDYDDADLSIKQRGEEFMENVRRVAKKQVNRKSGYVQVTINAQQQGVVSDMDSMPANEQDNMYADLSGAKEVILPQPSADTHRKGHSISSEKMPPAPPPRHVEVLSNQPQAKIPAARLPVPPPRKVQDIKFSQAPPPPARKLRPPFSQEQYLHGKISKDEADDILNNHSSGSFLVRVSSRKRQEGPNYVLSCVGCHSKAIASFELAHFPISATQGSKGWKYSIPSIDATMYVKLIEYLYYDSKLIESYLGAIPILLFSSF